MLFVNTPCFLSPFSSRSVIPTLPPSKASTSSIVPTADDIARSPSALLFLINGVPESFTDPFVA